MISLREAYWNRPRKLEPGSMVPIPRFDWVSLFGGKPLRSRKCIPPHALERLDNWVPPIEFRE